jgi:beta-lactamase superfamily II metal-dependent hydrolase
MKIEIFDVEHGQCAMITCPPDGKKLMIDAGHNVGKWRPSTHFKGQSIENLVITNFDEDHTSDIANIRVLCNVNAITRNPSITAAALRKMKAEGGMGYGVKHLHDWLGQIESVPGGCPVTVDLGHVQLNYYWVKYPNFTDTNNLSLVTFVSYGTFTILFPGDLEKQGWLKLLENPYFLAAVRRTIVLVASHHGRDNGRCEELYQGDISWPIDWRPYATIISDAGKEYSTQETTNWYANRTHGCKTRDGSKRKVFTTRSDGKITIDVTANGTWYIGPSGTTRQQEPLQQPLLDAFYAYYRRLGYRM